MGLLTVRASRPEVQYAIVGASETTTSATYADLTTPGPAVTLTVPASGAVKVIWGAYQSNNGTGIASSAIAVSGASTVAAATTEIGNGALMVKDGAAIIMQASRVVVLTGLTAGSTTFTVKYLSTAGTSTFYMRNLIVETLP